MKSSDDARNGVERLMNRIGMARAFRTAGFLSNNATKRSICEVASKHGPRKMLLDILVFCRFLSLQAFVGEVAVSGQLWDLGWLVW